MGKFEHCGAYYSAVAPAGFFLMYNNKIDKIVSALVDQRRRLYRRDVGVAMAIVAPLVVVGFFAESIENAWVTGILIWLVLVVFVGIFGYFFKGIAEISQSSVSVTIDGKKHSVFIDKGKQMLGVDSSDFRSMDMIVSAEGLGFFTWVAFRWQAYSFDTIEEIRIDTERRFLLPDTRITVVSKYESTHEALGLIAYQPRSLKKALAVLEEYGYGDLIRQ